MATCKNCIHLEACSKWSEFPKMYENQEVDCKHYKDKLQYIELPFKIGQALYDISEFLIYQDGCELYEVSEDRITIVKDRNGFHYIYDDINIHIGDLNETLFFSKKEAIKAIYEKTVDKESERE